MVFGLLLKFFFFLIILFTSLLCSQSSRSASHFSCLRPLGEEIWTHHTVDSWRPHRLSYWLTGPSGLPLVAISHPLSKFHTCLLLSFYIYYQNYCFKNKRLQQEKNKCSKDFISHEHLYWKAEKPVTTNFRNN